MQLRFSYPHYMRSLKIFVDGIVCTSFLHNCTHLYLFVLHPLFEIRRGIHFLKYRSKRGLQYFARGYVVQSLFNSVRFSSACRLIIIILSYVYVHPFYNQREGWLNATPIMCRVRKWVESFGC